MTTRKAARGMTYEELLALPAAGCRRPRHSQQGADDRPEHRIRLGEEGRVSGHRPQARERVPRGHCGAAPAPRRTAGGGGRVQCPFHVAVGDVAPWPGCRIAECGARGGEPFHGVGMPAEVCGCHAATSCPRPGQDTAWNGGVGARGTGRSIGPVRSAGAFKPSRSTMTRSMFVSRRCPDSSIDRKAWLSPVRSAMSS